MARQTLCLTLLLALAACEPKDKTPPPAPVVDPVASPTPLTRVSITGSAEFGSTVAITGGATDVQTTADAFTARWRAEVTLTPDKDNALSVTATDAAGNVSEATHLTVKQASSKPTALTLTLSSSNARAGELVGLAARVVDQYGNEMSDAGVAFETSPALPATFTLPNSTMTRSQGVLAGAKQLVAYDLSAVKDAGYTFEIKASAGTATDSQVLTVRPAAGQSFSSLVYTPENTSTALSLKAGEDAAYAYQVVDLYGNVTTGPVSVFTSAPGAIVVDDGISGRGQITRITTVGTYSISFYIAGVGQKGTLPLSVATAPGAFVDVTASSTLTSPQTPVKLFARIRDAFGNVIDCTTASTGDITFSALGNTTGAVAPAATTCFNGQFATSFTFAAEDNYALTATYKPTGVNVSANAFVTVLNFDNSPPQVSVQNITVNGVPCTPASRVGGPGCDAVNSDVVEFDAVATDNSALAQVAYNIFFASTQQLRTRTVFIPANQATATVHFRFTVSSNAIESTPLVAQAIDRAGNIMNSAAVSVFVNMGAPIGNRTLSTVATGAPLNGPTDVAFDNAGNLFILNRGNDSILRLAAGASTPAVFMTGVPSEFIVHGLVPGGERMWVSDRSNQSGVVRVFDPAAANPVLSAFATIGGGGGFQGVASGLAMMGSTPARGWLDLTSAVDGDRVTLTMNNSSMAYELDSNNTCAASPTHVCVTVAASATAAHKAVAVAAAITGNPSSVVTASASNARVLLASKTRAEPTGSTVVTIAKTGPLSLSAPQLFEGHDSDLWSANDGDNSIRRYLTSNGPFTGTNHGAFDVLTTQWGLAVRDIWTPSTDALFDSVSYFGDSGPQVGNIQTLRAYRTTVIGNGTTTQTSTNLLFAVSSTNTGLPQVNFSSLWDLAVAPNGCLLVSDDQGGNIYAVDVRNGASTAPAVERVARNLSGPRGLTFDAAGNLYIADRSGNAVLELTPDPAKCF